MPALEWIDVSGFKSIAATGRLALTPINVLIGPNGSGKSNFIGVFSFLHALREGRLQDYVLKAGGANRILHFGSKTTKEVRIRVAFRGETNQYEIAMERTEADGLVPTEEWGFYWDKARFDRPMNRGLWQGGLEAGISNSRNSDKIAEYVQKHLDRWRVYHFHDTGSDSPLKTTMDLNDNRYFRPNGSNLAPFLYYLKKAHLSSYNLIRNTIQQIAPFFDDFVLEPQKLNPDKIRLEWLHKKSDSYFDVSSLSDGTLRFIALATLFLQPDHYRPSVILVDEPELGLHPAAITILSSLIKSVSNQTQVILSTQSPFLLDHFEPNEVIVANANTEGTSFKRLKSDELEQWLDDYSLGQLWEKNEIGGRPGSI